MKWIGQHIYDQISRFRNDVYLEDISTGTIASGAHLGLDSNNKIVKAVDGGGDLTSIVAGTGLSGTSLTGPIPTLNVDASQPSITTLAGVSAIGTAGTPIVITSDAVTFSSVNADDPIVTIKNTSNDANDMASLKFVKDRGAAPAIGDNLAEIYFIGEDSGQNSQEYGRILCETDVVTDGQESGRLKLGVANHDGGNGYGLIMQGGSADNEVDVVIGLGTSSLTQIVGDMALGGDTITAAGKLIISATGNDIEVDTDNFFIQSATTQKPFLELKNTTNNNKGSTLQFTKDKGAAGADADIIGVINFVSDDTAQTQTYFAQILGTVSQADDTDEAGKLTFSVAESDGTTTTLTAGLVLEGEHATDGEVDVIIAAGAASSTTIAGTLTMGSTAAMDNSGLLRVTSQPNITTLAGLTSLGTAGATTDIAAGDLTMYNPVNNGNPTISVGKDANDRFAIETVYNSGAQTIDYINFQTYTTSSTNHDGRYFFLVDEVELAKIIDSGLYVTGNVQSLDADAQVQAIDTTASSATQGGKLRLISDDNAVMGDNHRLGVIQFEGAEDAGGGAGSNAHSIGARIQAVARDAWDGSNNDADLEFYTTDGTTESKVLTLDADKLATFTGAVTITGALTCTTDLATDQQKHLMHYNTTGYSNGSTEYQISESMNVNPVGNVEHDTNIGSDGLTGQTVQTWLRAGGHVMPRACTLKRWSGWSTSPTTGDDPEYGLFKVTLEDDVDSDPSAVLLTEVTHAASGNATANFMTTTTASSGGTLNIAAGDIVFFAIKGGGNFIFFNGTFEVEF